MLGYNYLLARITQSLDFDSHDKEDNSDLGPAIREDIWDLGLKGSWGLGWVEVQGHNHH